ncbi:MAG: hypothetical protein ABSC54_10055 [Smithellaceae bacterium]
MKKVIAVVFIVLLAMPVWAWEDKDCNKIFTTYTKAYFLVSHKVEWDRDNMTQWTGGACQMEGYVEWRTCEHNNYIYVSKKEFLDSNKKPFSKDYIIWQYKEVE